MKQYFFLKLCTSVGFEKPLDLGSLPMDDLSMLWANPCLVWMLFLQRPAPKYWIFKWKHTPVSLFVYSTVDLNLHLRRNLRDVKLEELTSLLEAIKDFLLFPNIPDRRIWSWDLWHLLGLIFLSATSSIAPSSLLFGRGSSELINLGWVPPHNIHKFIWQ